MDEADLDGQQQVPSQGQARQDKSLQTTRLPQLMQPSSADTVIAPPPHPHFRYSAVAMAPTLLKCQKSNLLNKLSESDHAPSCQALPLCMSSGDRKVPQPQAGAHQKVH